MPHHLVSFFRVDISDTLHPWQTLRETFLSDPNGLGYATRAAWALERHCEFPFCNRHRGGYACGPARQAGLAVMHDERK